MTRNSDRDLPPEGKGPGAQIEGPQLDRRRYIDTVSYSSRLRGRAILLGEEKLLIARLSGSEQEKDLSAPVNCRGYGRVRHFRLQRYDDWSPNPLPILPAAAALHHSSHDGLRAQVFQNAACNWRCWYCYVDFDRLAADLRVSDYFTADELLDLYLAEPDRPRVIDLTGGQPELVPEWVLWMMRALRRRGLDETTFLWSDDNLSNRYFWEYLSSADRREIAQYPKYARVGCFKGFDPTSFAFNTAAAPELFEEQFEIFRRLLHEGLDLYAYVTFTAPPSAGLGGAVRDFVDRLQHVHPNLPLRVVPLKIDVFTPTNHRMTGERTRALEFQHEVHAAWVGELARRFTEAERAMPINEVELRS